MTDVLLIIADNNFRDEELLDTKSAIENADLKIIIASKTTGTKKGTLGANITAELSLKDVNIEDFKAIVFIGGGGSSQYFDDTTALGLAKKAADQKKIIAAICIAPIILANAGILEGKKATIWDSGDGDFIKKIEAKGAIFTDKAVVQDGNIITGNGPQAASEFGNTIANALKK